MALAAVALLTVLTAAFCLNSAVNAVKGAFSGCCAGGFGTTPSAAGGSGAGASVPPAAWPSSTGPAASPTSQTPAVESAARVFTEALTRIFIESILLSWGTDQAAENARRLEWIAQSVREYERLHGVPPPSLEVLNVSRDDLKDVFGVPVMYRVQGQPPHWELRSAGANRRIDADDPWIAGP